MPRRPTTGRLPATGSGRRRSRSRQYKLVGTRAAAHRHPGQGHRQVHVRPEHPRARDAARPARAAARPGRVRRRHAAEDRLGRRELDQAHPGAPRRAQGRLPRRRRTEGVRRDPGRRAAEGEVGRPAGASRAAATCGSRCATSTAPGTGAGPRSGVNTGQRRHRARVGGEDGLGDLHVPLQRPRADRAELRGRRRDRRTAR